MQIYASFPGRLPGEASGPRAAYYSVLRDAERGNPK